MKNTIAISCTVKAYKRHFDYELTWECPHCHATNTSFFYQDRDPFDDSIMDFYTDKTCDFCGEESEIYAGDIDIEGDY